jgi:hypothetical protein
MDALTDNTITRCLVLAAMMIEQNKLYQDPNHPHNITPLSYITTKNLLRENILKQTK